MKEHSCGDLVENFSYIRKPRLRGIIILCMGFDKELDDFIYENIQILAHNKTLFPTNPLAAPDNMED